MADRGLTQQQLAALANSKQTTISNFLNNECSPTLRTVESLCRALGVTPRDMLSTRNATDLRSKILAVLQSGSELDAYQIAEQVQNPVISVAFELGAMKKAGIVLTRLTDDATLLIRKADQ